MLVNHQNGWKDYHDELLKSWRKQATISLWLSLASKYMYNRINNWLTYPSIILSAMTSIGIAGFECVPELRYILSGMTLLSGVLTGINQHVQAAEKSQEFYLRAKDYYSVVREIEYILSIDKTDRPPPNEVLITVRNTLDKIIDQQCDFPLIVIKEYEKKFRSLESALFPDLQMYGVGGVGTMPQQQTEDEQSDLSDKFTSTGINPQDMAFMHKSPSKTPLNSFNPINNSRMSGSFINDAMMKRKKAKVKAAATIITPYQLYNTNTDITSVTFASPSIQLQTNGSVPIQMPHISSLYKTNSLRNIAIGSPNNPNGGAQLHFNTNVGITTGRLSSTTLTHDEKERSSYKDKDKSIASTITNAYNNYHSPSFTPNNQVLIPTPSSAPASANQLNIELPNTKFYDEPPVASLSLPAPLAPLAFSKHKP